MSELNENEFIPESIAIDDYGFCKYCKWNSSMPMSHMHYSDLTCKYLKSNYNMKYDEDGELQYKLKKHLISKDILKIVNKIVKGRYQSVTIHNQKYSDIINKLINCEKNILKEIFKLKTINKKNEFERCKNVLDFINCICSEMDEKIKDTDDDDLKNDMYQYKTNVKEIDYNNNIFNRCCKIYNNK